MSSSSVESVQTVCDWLAGLRLEQYSGVFQEWGFSSMSDCLHLTPDQLECMGVALPGHRKRILNNLPRESGAVDQEVELKPVPKGRTKFSRSHAESPVPPIPPRVTPNCPPVRFTDPIVSERTDTVTVKKTVATTPPLQKPTPAPRPRPQNLPIKEAGSKAAVSADPTLLSLSPPLSSTSSLSSEHFHLYEQCSSPGQTGMGVPPLPPKCYPVAGLKEPPLPPRLPVPPPRVNTCCARTAATTNPPTHSLTVDVPVQENVPSIQPRIGLPEAPPRRRIPQPPTKTRSVSSDSSDEYMEPEPETPHRIETESMADKGVFLVTPTILYSDDELLCDDDNEPPPSRTPSWQDYGLSTLSGRMQPSICLPKEGRISTHTAEDLIQPLSPVIKMGWLDKNPPQGSIIYQKRWVKLDAEYLRYFDSEKEVYSKRIIPTYCITGVLSVGDQKFEVVTDNRIFLFRAESDLDRNDWVRVLQELTKDRQRGSRDLNINPTGTPEMQGYLELRGLRSKLYTVVCADKVFLYKNQEDFRLGVGITSIDMNVGNVKDSDRRAFDLTTPYRIFSFVAESEQQKEQWINVMRNAISEALSNYEVAEQIWVEPANMHCADCGVAKPEWAAINLGVVFCKCCAGEHRGLGPSISKVRSLKMDKKVWTEELIQVFLLLGNERANQFWAANVPPSEALTMTSSSEERRRFITAKYREGKYRRYHTLYGNQSELDDALCVNVQSNDLLETLSLIFCGADVNCFTGDPEYPSPISLAQKHKQILQVEFLTQNRNTEIPRSQFGVHMDTVHYMAAPSITHNGFLFKTASMVRLITERKAKEEFSRRWCTLNDGIFNYYESDKSSTPNGALKMKEIVCLAVDPPLKHGYDHTFELYSDSERLYLFGTDNPDTLREWVKSIAKSFIPAYAESLLQQDFERIGRLHSKDSLSLETPQNGWFCLAGSTLHICLENGHSEETIHLRKLQELSTQSDNVLVLVERGRSLYIEGERKLDFLGWTGAIQRAGSSGDSLSEQQLTDTDIPVIVDHCIKHITQWGLISDGIYRKSGVNSRISALLVDFRRDARSVWLKEGDHLVDDVANVLKRFFRDVQDGLFTSEAAQEWLSGPELKDDFSKVARYQQLFNRLPTVNKATLRALINHLYCVQCYSDANQMNLHNLAIVFGPTLFQTDGKDYNAGRVVEDLIQHYIAIFNVNEEQLKKQKDEISIIIKVRDKMSQKNSGAEPAGDFICTVYLEEKKESAEQHVKVPGAMTASELTCEILDRRKIRVREKDYWCCFEVNEKEETERPLHYNEKVLPIFHSLGTDSYLLVKKHYSMEAMLVYLASKVEVTKHGVVRFREERSLLGLGSFNERYFILTSTSLRMYKDIRSNRSEKEWPVRCLKVYLGIKKKHRPPTCWGLTVYYESDKQEKSDRQHWYLCCDTQNEMREWFATFLSIQHEGSLWPAEGCRMRVSRSVMADPRLGNVSLIPLRGSENEMRNSVAAFTADPLALFRNV
ncbi:arf-GAP with Rho-GAP domain, ANK repeat and PH domain-containing protein 1 isoform X2 [Denticeps clupeoides]|uniref:arf-GAP with Rho-GAP domain, ANK repeat and PH domain-containing protein 1 isoform X2 n=1 Tax=Denticeps clupeoides TaxID=299321 RepID=UPI0010A51F82|nr:arf-GAP with Rho-GAP domain, ANK repeat and PH domain-containing protein 1 isoform X2 [Denticeps clupeoides]